MIKKKLTALMIVFTAAILFLACPMDDIEALRPKPKEFTVTFNANGGNSIPQDKTVKQGEKVNEPPAMTRIGYDFDGWYKDTALHYQWDFTTDKVTSDITLNAKWTAITYAVRYHKNDAIATETMEDSIHTYDVAKNLTANAYTWDGYSFVKWNRTPDGTGASYNNGQSVTNLATTQGAIVDLYAQWTNITYTITFNTSGGGAVPQQTVPHGGTATRPPTDPTRANLNFDNWYGDSGLNTLYDYNTPVTGEITIYAKWVCKVTFDSRQGSLVDTQTVDINGTAILPTPAPTRDNYAFVNWYDNSGLNEPAYNFSTPVTGNLTLYAKWNINQYTVTFDSNGGTGSVSSVTKDYNTVITLPDPGGLSKTGYTFICWNTNSAGTGDNKNTGASYTVTRDDTLFAKWNPITYKVVYHQNNDNAEGSTADSIHTYDDPQNLTANGYSVPGYSFVEWTENPNGTGDAYINSQSVTNLADSQDAEVDLYAKWSNITHTVTFNANGGSSVPPQTIAHEGTAARPAKPTWPGSGYTFGDWYSDPGFTTVYDFSTRVIEDITIYARWGYTVTFNSNGGSDVAPQIIYDGERAVRPEDPNRPGYTFDNWYTSDSMSVLYQFSNPVNGNREIFARWIPAYTVQYNTNGGNGTMTETSHTVGIAQNLPVNTFTRTGYTFTGWATEAVGPVVYEDRESVTDLRTSAGATITLYAKWNPNTYTIRYNANGGSGDMEDSSHTYDEAKALNANTFTRRSFAFLGWSTTQGATTASYTDGQPVTNLSATAGATVTLYAVWELITIVPGADLRTKLNWVQSNAISDTEYIVWADFDEPAFAPFTLSCPDGCNNITIQLTGGADVLSLRTVTLSGNGSLFTVESGVTLVLDGYITLNGSSGNNAALVTVNSGGTLIMNTGSAITGNNNTSTDGRGGGVYVVSGIFTMSGGNISGNKVSADDGGGGGVFLDNGSEFNMNGGTIGGTEPVTANTATWGGGIHVDEGSNFIMSEGIISGNTATRSGGGVNVDGGNFDMRGGSISRNTAYSGGGVYAYGRVHATTVTMSGTTISGNTAVSGGGVTVEANATFTMTSGTITGNTATNGGGVHVNGESIFTMSGGNISGNTANDSGGGVSVWSGKFTMNGNATISGNTAAWGGGVFVYPNGIFTMSGGNISGNTAINGGGVHVIGIFRMVTGTIYGSNEANEELRNTAENGAALYKQASGVVERGTFIDETWVSKGDLSTTNNTIKVVNGVLQ